MKNKRIQRKRTKGWRMPDGAVSVCRPGKWGNPFKVGKDGTASECVEKFRVNLLRGSLKVTVNEAVQELQGKDLACFCALDSPCHADELLCIANNYKK